MLSLAVTVLTNMALGKQAYQTDSYVRNGHVNSPSNAVDNDTTSCSHPDTHDTRWEVDLGQKSLIDHVTIYNRQEARKPFLSTYSIVVTSKLSNFRL